MVVLPRIVSLCSVLCVTVMDGCDPECCGCPVCLVVEWMDECDGGPTADVNRIWPLFHEGEECSGHALHDQVWPAVVLLNWKEHTNYRTKEKNYFLNWFLFLSGLDVKLCSGKDLCFCTAPYLSVMLYCGELSPIPQSCSIPKITTVSRCKNLHPY